MDSRIPLALCAALCAWSPCMLASSAGAEMEEVVVTATRTEKLLRATPYSTSLITSEALLNETHAQLADVIGVLPGVFVSDAGQAGQKRVRIRGEEARRMALLIDGQEFIDHREVGVPLLVDTANIARIELVRGPASVLYGPKAMGGVINVITTRDYESALAGSLGITLNGASSGETWSANLGGALDDTRWELSFSDTDQEERDTPVGKIENTTYESRGFSGYIGHRSGAHAFGIGYERFESTSDVYVEPVVRFTPPFLDFGIDIPVRDREKTRIDYRYTAGSGYLASIKVDAYRQISDREFNTFPLIQLAPGLVLDTAIGTISELTSDGVNVQTDWSFGPDHAVVIGFQHVTDEVDQDRHRVVETNGVVTTDETVLDVARLTTDALYIQDDWTISPRFSLLAGARVYAVDGRHVASTRFDVLPAFEDEESVASVAVVYDAAPGVTLRANVSQGYIYPSLLNLAVGAFAGSRYVNPVADLDPETSLTRELGARFYNDKRTLDLTLFLTDADDYIDHVFCTPDDACLTSRDKIYRNIGEARSFGVEAIAGIDFDTFEAYVNATWMKRRKAYEGVDTWNAGIPELSGRVGVASTFREILDVDVFASFESSSDETEMTSHGPITDHHGGFVTFNAQLDWRPSDKYRVSVSLANLLDKTYSTATENLLAPGRHIRARFTYSL